RDAVDVDDAFLELVFVNLLDSHLELDSIRELWWAERPRGRKPQFRDVNPGWSAPRGPRGGVWGEAPSRKPLELEAAFARAFGEGLDAPVIEVAVAIEDDLRDALGLELSGDRLADELGRIALVRFVRRTLHVLGEGGAVGHRGAGDIVDDLGVD